MLFNVALVASVAMFFYLILEWLQLPGILGMIAAGMLLGPAGINFISPDVLKFSADLRSLALVIILIRVSLNIQRREIKGLGPVAVQMGIFPVFLEALFIALSGFYFWQMPILSASMLGLIVAAVSPAMVVPQMLELKAKILTAQNPLPTILLAGAALDNIVAITLFNALLQIQHASNKSVLVNFVQVPASILLGLALGVVLGYLFIWFFKKHHVRDTRKVMVFMAIAVILLHLEEVLPMPVSGLLGVMAMGFVLLEKYEILAQRLALKFSKIWISAELMLFVLVGAQVNWQVVRHMGPTVVLLIALGLLGRAIGVLLALRGKFTIQEQLFSLGAFLPKASVQAALGAIPLSFGLPGGELILGISVVSILLTAPMGALAIREGMKKYRIPG